MTTDILPASLSRGQRLSGSGLKHQPLTSECPHEGGAHHHPAWAKETCQLRTKHASTHLTAVRGATPPRSHARPRLRESLSTVPPGDTSEGADGCTGIGHVSLRLPRSQHRDTLMSPSCPTQADRRFCRKCHKNEGKTRCCHRRKQQQPCTPRCVPGSRRSSAYVELSW